MKRRLAWTLVLASLVSGATSLAWAIEPPAGGAEQHKFVRIDRDAAGELKSLDTAVVHFVPSNGQQAGLVVDLVGAIHVGDKSYYEALNKLFESYDVVLYELVAPEGTRVPKGGQASTNPVALLQNGMKDLLGLEHQLQFVDYTRQNMVHADMSPDDFAKSMSDRNESMTGMIFRMMGQALAQQSKVEAQGKTQGIDLWTALFSNDRAGALKRVMAEQFENMEDLMEAFEGPQGSTIITERNKVALSKLAKEIAAGKKKIAVFYGAGHLGDMEKRLIADFHLKRSGEQWLVAWNLVKPSRADAK